MFNVLKDHKSKSSIQKHILKGFLILSQCLLNVISATRVHQHWHWKAPSATVPPPSAVQPYPTAPAMVSRHCLKPGPSFSCHIYLLHLPFQPWCWQTMLFRKLRGSWFTWLSWFNPASSYSNHTVVVRSLPTPTVGWRRESKRKG